MWVDVLCWIDHVWSSDCFQYTNTAKFIVQIKESENHYLYHDTQTQLHIIIEVCSYNL